MRSLDQVAFAVVDVETTGVFANKYDRVVEVVVCRFAPDGHRADFVTLLNPERDIGPTNIHGLTPRDVIHAPKFAEIVGDLLSYVGGAVVVGHNVQFDLSFIDAECRRAGIALPPLPTICTLRLACQLGKAGRGRSLRYCCDACGIVITNEHCALDDAIAAGELLQAYLSEARKLGHATVEALGCTVPFPIEFPSPRPSGRRLGRNDATRLRKNEPSYLARLVTQLMGRENTSIDFPKLAPYFELLDRVLEDRLVDEAEVEALNELAMKWDLTGQEVCAAHRQYLADLASAAMADGIVSEAERRDLESVAQMLGFDSTTLGRLLVDATDSNIEVRAKPGRPDYSLSGKSVCFTGTSQCKLNGEAISRDLAERLAADAGLTITKGVTKTLDILVVADPVTQSTKARKAKVYGTRIMAEPAFWRCIGVNVE